MVKFIRRHCREVEVSGLTREERNRMVKAFLMVSGGIALAMFFFAAAGQLNFMTMVLAVVGISMVLASSVLFLLGHPARVVYGTMVIGIAVMSGAGLGSVVWTAAFR